MKVNAYAQIKPGEDLRPFTYELDEPKANEVQIRVKYCGLCHTDLHYVKDGWAESYPFVPGHEIVGEVTQAGEKVKNIKVGDMVGVGWQCGSCMKCSACKSGMVNICLDMKETCIDQFGGFGEYVNINERYAFLIRFLDEKKVAPLLCGGITVFNPLDYYEVKPWMKVGVVGIGGLGHMALMFADKSGCEVFAFSSSPDKEKEARRLGADHFITDILDEKLDNSLDFILSTVSAQLKWDRYLQMLKPEGKFCFVGIPGERIDLDFFQLMMYQKQIVAGSIGSPLTISRMLDFAGRHKIEPMVELMPMSKVNEAIERLAKNEVRYRVVLEIGK